MEKSHSDTYLFGRERIGKVLWKIAPPVMLAQLIQALYNIVDSFFVGRYSPDALTALTVIYPLQLIIIALAVGTGVGVNTYMARKFAMGQERDAEKAAGTGSVLAALSWAVFALLSLAVMRPYVRTSATTPLAVEYAVLYGNIVCAGSLGAFLEGCWTKVLQSRGDMLRPTAAQVAGALVNIALDPLLIFGWGPVPGLGVAGAAIATVVGQGTAAAITGVKGFCPPPRPREMVRYARRIYFYGYSSILMQSLYTVYIVALNVILAGFSDAAVTVLGLYYKLQSFFFIPLLGLQTCIVPVLSFNCARKSYSRCKNIMRDTFLISAAFMAAGIVCFVFFPRQLMSLFSPSPEVLRIGSAAFPIIGTGFLSAVFALTMPVFFQAVGDGKTSVLLAVARQLLCLVPIFWLFSLIGLNYTWLSFPISETVSGGIGLVLYRRQTRRWDRLEEAAGAPAAPEAGVRIITVSREFGSGGRELGKRLADALGFDYYDKEIIAAVAKNRGLDQGYVERALDNHGWQKMPITFCHSFVSASPVRFYRTSLLLEQRRVIEDIARLGKNCVIVGRNADMILRAFRPFNLFVCADQEAKIQRCVSRAAPDEDVSEETLVQKMRAIDKGRIKTRELMMGSPWGDRSTYHLTVNTTGWSLKELTPAVAGYAQQFFDRRAEMRPEDPAPAV